MDLFGEEGPGESCTEIEVFTVEVIVDLIVEGRGVLAGWIYLVRKAPASPARNSRSSRWK